MSRPPIQKHRDKAGGGERESGKEPRKAESGQRAVRSGQKEPGEAREGGNDLSHTYKAASTDTWLGLGGIVLAMSFLVLSTVFEQQVCHRPLYPPTVPRLREVVKRSMTHIMLV